LTPFEQDAAMKARYADLPGVIYVSLLNALCDEHRCRVFAAPDTPVLWDYGHFTQEGAEFVVRSTMEDPLRRVLAASPPPG
jgi:hypothetical protein